ncbi:bifunctional DNA primase/polymerase [Pseudonocardia xishanensis]|uniref:Bifunctional DNA primase/polymerase n=1 Tax=Pseudonocardia xishanensis TaxID=630995 RepID=A0ABP8RZB7_9PSEU
MAGLRSELRLLRHALAASARYPVFPIRPRGKTPAFEGWQERATQDERLIRSWFEARPYNIGVVTGRPDLFVVDLDSVRGDAAPPGDESVSGGWEVLARLARRSGHRFPGETHTVGTPTGGLHLYFTLPQGLVLPNSSGRLGFKIDTRGRGGYIVGAGSARPEGLYRVIRRGPAAVLPDWMVDALTPRPLPEPAPIPTGLSPTRIAGYVATPLREECEAVAAAAPGQRHHALLRAARILGEFVGAQMLDRETARVALLAACRAHIGVDGFTAHEAERAISDGIAYGSRRPRTPGGR